MSYYVMEYMGLERWEVRDEFDYVTEAAHSLEEFEDLLPDSKFKIFVELN